MLNHSAFHSRSRAAAKRQSHAADWIKDTLLLTLAGIAALSLCMANKALGSDYDDYGPQLAQYASDEETERKETLNLEIPQSVLSGHSAGNFPDPQHKLRRTDVLLPPQDRLQPQMRDPDPLRILLEKPRQF